MRTSKFRKFSICSNYCGFFVNQAGVIIRKNKRKLKWEIRKYHRKLTKVDNNILTPNIQKKVQNKIKKNRKTLCTIFLVFKLKYF